MRGMPCIVRHIGTDIYPSIIFPHFSSEKMVLLHSRHLVEGMILALRSLLSSVMVGLWLWSLQVSDCGDGAGVCNAMCSFIQEILSAPVLVFILLKVLKWIWKYPLNESCLFNCFISGVKNMCALNLTGILFVECQKLLDMYYVKGFKTLLASLVFLRSCGKMRLVLGFFEVYFDLQWGT